MLHRPAVVAGDAEPGPELAVQVGPLVVVDEVERALEHPDHVGRAFAGVVVLAQQRQRATAQGQGGAVVLEQPLEQRAGFEVPGALFEQRLELVEGLAGIVESVEEARRDLDPQDPGLDRRERGQAPPPQVDQVAPPLLPLEQAGEVGLELGVAAVELELLDHVVGGALLLIGEVLGHVRGVVEQALARGLVGGDRERAVVDPEQLGPLPRPP